MCRFHLIVRSSLTLVFVTSIILQYSSNPVLALNEESEATSTPESAFIPILVENFEGGQAKNFSTNNLVDLQPQKLLIKPNGSASFPFQELSQANIEIQFGNFQDDIPNAFQLTLTSANSPKFVIDFTDKPAAKKNTHTVTLTRVSEGEGNREEEVLRTYQSLTNLPSAVSLEYSFGLLAIKYGDQRKLIGYYKHPNNAIDSMQISVSSGSLIIKTLKVAINATQTPALTGTQQSSLAEADEQNKALMTHYRAGKFKDAAQCGERVLEIRRDILGRQHRDYAASLNNLAALYYNMGEYEKTAPLFIESAETRKLTLGSLHPEYAQSLNNSAALKNMLGDYTSAIALFREASNIWKEVLGQNHYEYATSLHNLAKVHSTIGEYSIAENLYQESTKIVKANYGGEHAEYATSLNNLALLYEQMGDLDRAELLYRECKEIRLKALGKEHPAYATVLNNLGTLYRDQGDYEKATPLLEASLETHRKAFGENHTSFATSLNNLALLYQQQARSNDAQELMNQASEIILNNLGSQHPLYAESLINRGNLHETNGNAPEAEKAFLAALEIRKTTFGDDHPDYGSTLQRLAKFYYDHGDGEKSDQFSSEATRIQRNQLNKNAIAQSARQQIANQNKLRSYLDLRLSNAVLGNTTAKVAAQEMWQWKGSVTRRQQAYRRISNTPHLIPIYNELQTITQKLSSLVGNVPPIPRETTDNAKQIESQRKRDLWQSAFDRLSRQREALEREIAALSEDYRRIDELLTVEKVQSCLPKKTAFIDILRYQHFSNSTSTTSKTNINTIGQPRFVGFIVQPNREPVLVSLGDANQISLEIERFRSGLTSRSQTDGERETTNQAANQIRKQIWQPIEKHLDGIETILISSDNSVSTLPFHAIPGRRFGDYLLEDYRIAYLPMAQQLEQILIESNSNTQIGQLLVVGDVDYDAKHSETGSPEQELTQEPVQPKIAAATESLAINQAWKQLRANTENNFQQLDGFERELELITKLRYQNRQKIVALRGSKATKSAFLEKSAESSILHVITHGYFAKDSDTRHVEISDPLQNAPKDSDNILETLPESRSIATFTPGLLSGLAFAGANRSSEAEDMVSDGILRSSEIEVASLKSVKLVVLSACETGLGKAADGEGITGLQRAFQIAGAESVVASLWKVDDQATVELMKLFYTNLWKHGMSRLDSIREAQLTMLNRYDPKTGQVRGLGSQPVKRDLNQDNLRSPNPIEKMRLAPRYWAAFQLSGDWR